MSEHEQRIEVADRGSVTTIVSEPEGAGDITLIYAPGASANVHDPFGRFLCREAAERGVRAVRFQFLYAEAGRKAPDKPDVLEETWRAVIAQFGGTRLVVGGRSMGGRIASQVVAQGENVDGLALFAYPLHPPGRPERSRTEHLPQISVPTLFVSGSRDTFGSPEELGPAAACVPSAMLHVLEHADHGFNVPKSSGRTRDDVFSEAVEVFWEWLQAIG